MGLAARFDKKNIIPLMDRKAIIAKIEADLYRILEYTGNEFVRDARLMTKDQGGFGDVTGNLRSSIGYFILKDGEVVKENLRKTTGTTIQVSAEGKEAARKALVNVEKRSGYQLVGVAGMDYAREVESRGLNVITAQKEVAIVNLNKRLKKYEAKIRAMGLSFAKSGELVITDFAA